MIARYADLISATVNQVMSHRDGEGAGDPKMHFLYTCIYPFISIAMWKGLTTADIVTSRMTADIMLKLRADGFVVRRPAADTKTQFTTIDWGPQRVWDDDGAEQWVSSTEYIAWCDKLSKEHNFNMEEAAHHEDGLDMGWGVGGA